MMTPINYLLPDAEGSYGELVDVSHDRQTVWLTDDAAETEVEWTLKSITAVWGDIDDDGWPTKEARDAMRASRVFQAIAVGATEVDLDVDDWATREHSAAVVEAFGLRRHGHPSLSAAERG